MVVPEFWLSYNNGAEKLRLPVPPPVVNVVSPFGNEDIEIVNGMDFTVIGFRGLKEFSMETFFPRDYNPTYCDYKGFPVPLKCVALLEKWRDTRRPLRFIVTGTNINHAVTIRDFPHDYERAGEPGDIYFSLVLKEYQFTKIGKKVDVKKTPPKQTARPPVVNKGTVTKPGGTYTVKNGDSLTKIAFAIYGRANRFKDIHNANSKLIGPDPNKIKAGMKLVLPK